MRLILILVLFIHSVAFAQELEPFINYIRSTPAYVNGEVSFSADSILYQEGWSIVKIVKNQPLQFSFKENWVQVTPGNAFYVKYGGFRVYIDSVTWTPKGMVTKSRLPADFTGLSEGLVSHEVAQTLEDLFGAKLKKANSLLNTIRRQKTMGGIFSQTKNMISVFTAGDSTLNLPSYRGEVGLNFIPSTAKALNLYGMRISIKQYDHYRCGFKFTGNQIGVSPYSINMSSRDGLDINKGREWAAMARLVLSEITLDSRGIDLKMHLGASEIITGLLSLAERAARTRDPGARCDRCEETASFPAVRIQVETYVRQSMMEQVKALWPYLPGLNVSRNVMNAFSKREKCREDNLVCLKKASGNSAAAKACDRTLNACMK